MPKTDIKLYSTDSSTGAKITTSVTYVNPNVSNAVLKSFAQQLNSLTTNNYTSTDRIETVNVDTENSRKQHRDIQITNNGTIVTVTLNKEANEDINPAAFYNGTMITLTKEQSDTDTIGKYSGNVHELYNYLYVGIAERDNFFSAFALKRIA